MKKNNILLCLEAVHLRDCEGKKKHDEIFCCLFRLSNKNISRTFMVLKKTNNIFDNFPSNLAIFLWALQTLSCCEHVRVQSGEYSTMFFFWL